MSEKHEDVGDVTVVSNRDAQPALKDCATLISCSRLTESEINEILCQQTFDTSLKKHVWAKRSDQASRQTHRQELAHTFTLKYIYTQLEVCHAFRPTLTTLSPRQSTDNHGNCLVTECQQQCRPKERSKFTRHTLSTHTHAHIRPSTPHTTNKHSRREVAQLYTHGGPQAPGVQHGVSVMLHASTLVEERRQRYDTVLYSCTRM